MTARNNIVKNAQQDEMARNDASNTGAKQPPILVLFGRIGDNVRNKTLVLIIAAAFELFGTYKATASTIEDSIEAGQNILFGWTVKDDPFGGQWTYDFVCGNVKGPGSTVAAGVPFNWNKIQGGNQAGQACSFTFHAPATATDWKQKIVNTDGTSDVFSGNIEKDSPWHFEPLDTLPPIPIRIPDVSPRGASQDTTIYTAVNLDLYALNNPSGFLDGSWSVGDTLQSIGVNIVNGEVAGVLGIYWATTPFDFNPDPLSRGFTPQGGDGNLLNSASYPFELEITQQHTNVPEPVLSLTTGCALLFVILKARKRAYRRHPGGW